MELYEMIQNPKTGLYVVNLGRFGIAYGLTKEQADGWIEHANQYA